MFGAQATWIRESRTLNLGMATGKNEKLRGREKIKKGEGKGENCIFLGYQL